MDYYEANVIGSMNVLEVMREKGLSATADDFACVFYDTEYAVCLENFRRQLVTVTALASFIACFLMGVGANLPFALAPGMGLNAYFTYDVVGFRGTGRIKWKIAMAAIFLEGIVFVVLTIVASGYFNLVRRANEEAGTTWERLDGISRASFGAVLFWSAKKSRDGAPPSGADKDETLAIVILDALSMVLLLGVAVYHHIYKERVKEDVDDNTITMDDYAVEVRGLPPDATEESVRAHFERHCGPVHEITFGRDVLEVMELRKKALALEANHELLEWMLKKSSLGEDMLLLGDPGPRSRQLVHRWCEACNREVEYVAVTRDTCGSDLKQRRELSGRSSGWADAPPVSAAKRSAASARVTAGSAPRAATCGELPSR